LGIPIGTVTKIGPKGFTLGIKGEKENNFFNLSFYGPDFAPGREMIRINVEGDFATLWANVATIKYCFDEIHTIGLK
jgi:hypothetical protein